MKNNKNNNKKKPGKDRKEREPREEEVKVDAKPKKVTPPATSARELLARYHLPVGAKGTLSAILAKLGYKPIELPGWNDAALHPVAHYARDLMRLFAMRDLATLFDPDTLSLVMWDLFGREFNYDGPNCKVGVGARIMATRPLEFGGDASRVELDQNRLMQAHGAMMVDIYQEKNHLTAITPQQVADAARLTMGNVCYFIAHRLRDPIGGTAYVATVYGEEGQQRDVKSLEEVWWPDRNNPDLMVFRADPMSAPYPLHPVRLAWLDQKVHALQNGWLHVSELSVLGSMHLWKCKFTNVQPLEVGMAPEWPSRYRQLEPRAWQTRIAEIAMGGSVREFLDQKIASVWGSPKPDNVFQELYWFRTWGQVVWYDAEASLRLQDIMRFKILGGRLLQGLAKDVDMYMGNTHGALHWMSSNIDLKAVVAHNTLLHAILCAGDAGQVQAIDAFRSESAEVEEARQRIARASPYDRQASTWVLGKKVAVVLGVVGFLGGANYLWNRRTGKWQDFVAFMAAAFLAAKQGLLGRQADLMSELLKGPKAIVAAGWIPNLCVLGEELFKFAWPRAGVAFAFGEALGYLWNGATVKDRLPALGFHLATCGLYASGKMSPANSLSLCISLHASFNAQVVNKISFDRWAEEWAQGRVPTEIGVAEIPTDVRFRAFEANTIVAPEFADWRLDMLHLTEAGRKYTLAEADQAFRLDACECWHTGRCADCKEAPYLGFSYPLLTAGLLYQPMIGIHTDVAATVSRAFKDPTKGALANPEDEVKFHNACMLRLAPAVEAVCDMLDTAPQPTTTPTIAECGKVMGGQRGRNFVSTAEAMDVGNSKHRISMMGKSNETIKGQGVVLPNGAGRPTVVLKPRVIRNVSTEYQVDAMQEARVFKAQLAAVFDGKRVFQIGRYRVRFVVAKVGQLNEYAELLASTREVCIVVSCDDCVFAAGDFEGTRVFPTAFGENDFEAWDQSQLAAFWAAFRQFCKTLELSEAFEESITATAQLAFSTKRGLFEMRGIAHMQMATGVAVTSDLGSLFDIMTWVHAMLEDRPFEVTCRELGIGTKLVAHNSLEGATFLKGWFVPTDSGSYTWANLPSCVLKMGKIFRRPGSLASEGDPHKAALICQGAICSSFPLLEEAYPIVGSYLKKVRDLLRAGGLEERAKQIALGRYVAENAEHKNFSLSPNRRAVLRLMEIRYGTTEAEIVQLERLFSVVQRLPSVVSHPLLQKMIDVDYE